MTHSLNPRADFRVYAGSTLFFICLFTSGLIVGPLVLLCAVFPFSVRYKLAGLWVQFILWSVKTCCGLSYEVEGLENIKNIKAAVVLSKHQSAWETIAFRHILPRQTALLKRSLLWLPVWGWALAVMKPIAIDRNHPREALKTLTVKGKAYLKQGFWVIIFPEGTRVAPGKKISFNGGGALLARQSGFPVIPIAHNAGEFWPRYSFLKYPGIIKVRIGPPIESKNRKTADINAEAQAWVTQTMKAISPLEARLQS
ncbi:MAG: 1-acyl-sn-glycerol-3-phosphate acyltransferase [Gammaproteobacteria bacterium HGW-Gammaproteobacteria-3]|nr:MAG: 1-acyl-sn-glycerol-3-phosphate acyltransferase [Gammaproteobacteria bacterium HGW-Gammaproteobacteria-3]